MDECQFYDKKRLEQLHRREEQLFVEAKEKNDLPADLTNYEARSLVACCFCLLVAFFVFFFLRCCFFLYSLVCGLVTFCPLLMCCCLCVLSCVGWFVLVL